MSPWLLLLVPVLWLLQNVQHEGCHALAVLAFGGTVTGFYPWPGKLNGRWTMARCEWTLPAGTPAVVAAAPLLANTALLFLTLALHSLTGWPWLLVVAVLNFVDGAFNLATFARRTPVPSDCRTWAAEADMPAWEARVVASCWIVGGGAGLGLSLWSHG